MNNEGFFNDDDWDEGQGVPIEGESIALITFEDDGFRVNEDALEVLNNIEAPIAVVAVAGLYRTGKSFLLNRVLLQGQGVGFTVGPTVRACTKGIWMWSAPIIVQDSDGRDIRVVVIDTEGIGAPTADATHDTRIFALGLLLASYFIYNSVGNIDEQALSNMSLVTNISKEIRVHATSEDEDAAVAVDMETEEGVEEDNAVSERTEDTASERKRREAICQFFPAFMWVVRDFALQLQDANGKTMGSREYLEDALRDCEGRSAKSKNKIRGCLREYFPERDCVTLVRPCTDEANLQRLDELPNSALRSEFMEQARSLRTKVLQEAARRPNRMNDCELSGSMLGMLCRAYVKAINDGRVPIIQDAWSYVCEAQRTRVQEKHLMEFQMQTGNLLCDTRLITPPQFTYALSAAKEERCTAFEKTCLSLYPEEDPSSEVRALRGKLELAACLASRQHHLQYQNQLSSAATAALDALDGSLGSKEFAAFSDFRSAVTAAYVAYRGELVDPGCDLALNVDPDHSACAPFEDEGDAVWLRRAEPLIWRAVSQFYSAREQNFLSLKAELERVQAKVSELGQQHGVALERLTQQHREELQKNEEEHQTALDAAMEETEDGRQAVTVLQERATALEAQVLQVSSESSAAIAELEQELERERMRGETVVAEVENMKREMEELEQEAGLLSEQARQVGELTFERDRLAKEAADAKRSVQEQKRSMAAVEATFRKEAKDMQTKALQSLQSMKDTRRAEQVQLRTARDKARSKCEALEGTVSAIQEELEVMKQHQLEAGRVYEDQVQILRGQVETAEARVAAVTKDHAQRLTVAEKERKVCEREMEATIVRARDERLRLEQEWAKKMKECENRAVNAESRLNENKRQLDAAEERIQRKRARTEDTERTLALVKSEAELTFLRQQKSESDTHLHSLRREKMDLENKVRKLERTMDSQLTRVKLEYEGQIAQLEQKMLTGNNE